MLAVLAALTDFWGTRYGLNPDGISYIEMARHALAGAPDGLINGYWSPGYPALLMPVLWLARNNWVLAVPAMHAVNVVLFLLSLAVFLTVLRSVQPADADGRGTVSGLGRYTTAFGVAAFLAIAIPCIGFGLITPDFGVMLFVLLAVLCCVQLERSAHGWRVAMALGLVLGLGYWMKAILLPMNVLLLAGLLVFPPRAERARAKVLLAACVFVLTVLPLIALVSARVGHFSTGEVGKLAYVWEVDGDAPAVGWVGQSMGALGTPAHAPRVVQADPQTLEFATPINATYPLWFDPAYWNAGIRPRVELGVQLRQLRKGLQGLGEVLRLQWAVVLGLLLLAFATVRSGGSRERSNIVVLIPLWSLAAAVIYSLVYIEARYLAGFICGSVIMAWAALVRRTARPAMRFTLPVVLAGLLVSLVGNVYDSTGGFSPSYRPAYLVDAAKLHEIGVARGDRVAMVGDGWEAYATFGAETPIIAQVMDSVGFWQLTPTQRQELQVKVAAIGVRAMLANNVTPEMRAEGWQIFSRADSTNLGVLMLRP